MKTEQGKKKNAKEFALLKFNEEETCFFFSFPFWWTKIHLKRKLDTLFSSFALRFSDVIYLYEINKK